LRLAALSAIAWLCLSATPLTPGQRRLNLDSFEYVWRTVQDKHWDPKLGGVDWQAVHDELLPRLQAAQTAEESRAILAAMLDRLHQTHFAIIPAEAYQNLGDTADGQTGIDLRFLDGSAIVTSVAPDSSASRAGVRTGWEIVRIGKTPVAHVIAGFSAQSEKPLHADLLAVRALRSQLDGPIDSEVPVEFADIHGTQFTKRLSRRIESGQLTRFGFLPAMVVRFDSRKLAGDVEYIHFNLFLDAEKVVTKFGDAMHECGQCSGVVIDLRGNPGGLGGMAMGIAGFFIAQQDQKLGTMYMRNLPLRFVIFPRAQVYAGPVAILVDAFTASTSEIFAGGMQDLKRARIFGERTAGAALPSMIERLPNGDGFQYAVANYTSESGRELEGNGVIPDVAVPLDRAALAEGRDAALEAALQWVHSVLPR
jgi:carboxyl-terminal processing protease